MHQDTRGGFRAVPVLQEGLHLNVSKRLGREVERPDREGDFCWENLINHPFNSSCKQTIYQSETFLNMSRFIYSETFLKIQNCTTSS